MRPQLLGTPGRKGALPAQHSCRPTEMAPTPVARRDSAPAILSLRSQNDRRARAQQTDLLFHGNLKLEQCTRPMPYWIPCSTLFYKINSIVGTCSIANDDCCNCFACELHLLTNGMASMLTPKKPGGTTRRAKSAPESHPRGQRILNRSHLGVPCAYVLTTGGGRRTTPHAC